MSSLTRVLAAVNVGRVYRLGSEEIVAVDDVSLDVPAGKFVALVGRSGQRHIKKKK